MSLRGCADSRAEQDPDYLRYAGGERVSPARNGMRGLFLPWLRGGKGHEVSPRLHVYQTGLLVLSLLYLVFCAYVAVKKAQDARFGGCFAADRYLLPATLAWSVAMVFFPLFAYGTGRLVRFRITIWLATLCWVVAFVVFHYVQLRYISRAFRGPSGRMDVELQLGFGQLLVFFMILQLLVEFGVGFYCESRGRTYMLCCAAACGSGRAYLALSADFVKSRYAIPPRASARRPERLGRQLHVHRGADGPGEGPERGQDGLVWRACVDRSQVGEGLGCCIS